MTINLEYTLAKEFIEDVVIAGAFDVVMEIGEKEVLYVGGVGSADAMGEVEERVDLKSG